MKNFRQFTGVIEQEGDGYVSLCPELDIASQGNTVEDAKLEVPAECNFLKYKHLRMRLLRQKKPHNDILGTFHSRTQ